MIARNRLSEKREWHLELAWTPHEMLISMKRNGVCFRFFFFLFAMNGTFVQATVVSLIRTELHSMLVVSVWVRAKPFSNE